MLINVVTKRTADGKFLGYNVLIHDSVNEDARYTVKTKLNVFEGFDFYIGVTENRYANFLPIVRYLKENLDILEKTEGNVDDYASFLAAAIAAEFRCTARAGKD